MIAHYASLKVRLLLFSILKQTVAMLSGEGGNHSICCAPTGSRIQITTMPALLIVGYSHALRTHQPIEKTLSAPGRAIGYLLHESWHVFTQHRIKGISSILEAHGSSLDKSYVRYLNGAPDDGYAATHDLLNTHPQITALYCANDRMAYGAIDAARERGLLVGNDISICGYDDHEHARYTHPALTTIRTPINAMAREGLSNLLSKGPVTPGVTHLPGEIILRESTGPAPEGG